jgi:ankyrin repeat protein
VSLHQLLDFDFGPDGGAKLGRALEGGADPDARDPNSGETLLHVAARRRRCGAIRMLLRHGATVDAPTAGDKTAWVHAIRRGFDDVAALLAAAGADTSLTDADKFAVAIVYGELDEAKEILAAHPGVVRTGNLEEDRLLADVAGRGDARPVEMLIAAGADLTVPGLDDGTPLHQAAWFGQPENAQLLIDAGAPLDIFDRVHGASPIGWCCHGSSFSEDPASRRVAYVAVAELLIGAGASLHYPEAPQDDGYILRLLEDASPAVREVIQKAVER